MSATTTPAIDVIRMAQKNAGERSRAVARRIQRSGYQLGGDAANHDASSIMANLLTEDYHGCNLLNVTWMAQHAHGEARRRANEQREWFISLLSILRPIARNNGPEWHAFIDAVASGEYVSLPRLAVNRPAVSAAR